MLLLKKFETARKNIVLDSVVSDILRHQGALTVGQLSKENFVCSRQMERLLCGSGVLHAVYLFQPLSEY